MCFESCYCQWYIASCGFPVLSWIYEECFRNGIVCPAVAYIWEEIEKWANIQDYLGFKWSLVVLYVPQIFRIPWLFLVVSYEVAWINGNHVLLIWTPKEKIGKLSV